MASIASKNLFDLLGDDGEPQVQAGQPAKAGAVGKGNVRGGRTVPGNEQVFRDRNTGSQANRSRTTEERRDDNRGPRREGGRGRGGRGARGGRGGAPSDDRHSKTGHVDTEKAVGQNWGANTGGAEWADEQAGDAIAKKDGAEATEGEAADAEPAEEEVKTKTLDDYLAEQAEKRLQVSAAAAARKANEGSKQKFPTGKEVTKEEEEDFIAGSGGKKQRERSKKDKNVLELDGDAMRITDSGRGDRRGGRGGGRGRGGDRGDRPEREHREPREPREPRGDRENRGGDRGGRGRGRGEGRGDFRGGRGRGGPRGGAAGSNAPNITDTNAFPSLG